MRKTLSQQQQQPNEMERDPPRKGKNSPRGSKRCVIVLESDSGTRIVEASGSRIWELMNGSKYDGSPLDTKE